MGGGGILGTKYQETVLAQVGDGGAGSRFCGGHRAGADSSRVYQTPGWCGCGERKALLVTSGSCREEAAIGCDEEGGGGTG